MAAAMEMCEARAGPLEARELVLTNRDLLQKIFQFLDLKPDLLYSVPLVCKAFYDAQGCSGSCWAALEVDGLRLTTGPPVAADAAAQFWARLASWVVLRAGGLRTLRLANLRHLLQQLEGPARLAALAGLWKALGSSPGGGSRGGGGEDATSPAPALHTLEVGRSSIGLAPGTLASMSCLSRLRCLELHTASHLDFAELDCLAGGLPLLERLHVSLMRRRGEFCCFRGPFPRRLTQLARLRSLRLEAPYSALNAATCVLPDSIQAWGPQLQELHLINLGLERLPPAIGRLSALRELCLARNRLGHHPAALPWDLTQLTGLRRLELNYNGFDGGAPPVVGELAGLEELNLGGNLWGSTAYDLPAEYGQLSQLKYLTLTNCELSALPPVVRTLSTLVLLKLNINNIQTLPAGPYLYSLEMLDIAHNRFTAGYPPALAAASRLQLLSFQHNGVHYSDPGVALREALAPQPPAQLLPQVPALAAAVTAVALPPPLPGPAQQAQHDGGEEQEMMMMVDH